jgi:hypothetical protein
MSAIIKMMRYLLIFLLFEGCSTKETANFEFDSVKFYGMSYDGSTMIILTCDPAMIHPTALEDSPEFFTYILFENDTIGINDLLSISLKVNKNILSELYELSLKLDVLEGKYSNEIEHIGVSFNSKGKVKHRRVIKNYDEFETLFESFLPHFDSGGKNNIVIEILASELYYTREFVTDPKAYHYLFAKHKLINDKIFQVQKWNENIEVKFKNHHLNLNEYSLSRLVQLQDSISKPYLSSEISLFRKNNDNVWELLAKECPTMYADCR